MVALVCGGFYLVAFKYKNDQQFSAVAFNNPSKGGKIPANK